MTSSYTATRGGTFTVARAREVMQEVLADFMNVASAGLIDREVIQEWHAELSYAVENEVIDTFQLQLHRPVGEPAALGYAVKADGSVQETSRAGGIDFHSFPTGTAVRLRVHYRMNAPKLEAVREYLRARGWTTGGSMVEGSASRDRAYSKDGYGITRSRVGDWG